MRKILVHVLFIFLMLVLVVSLFHRVNGGSALSFSGLLDFFSSSKSFQLSANISDFTISGSWGMFDFFRSFLNIFAYVLGLLVWLAVNLVNLILFLLQFVSFLFY